MPGLPSCYPPPSREVKSWFRSSDWFSRWVSRLGLGGRGNIISELSCSSHRRDTKELIYDAHLICTFFPSFYLCCIFCLEQMRLPNLCACMTELLFSSLFNTWKDIYVYTLLHLHSNTHLHNINIIYYLWNWSHDTNVLLTIHCTSSMISLQYTIKWLY